MAYVDKTLECVDCGASFTFGAAEQPRNSSAVVGMAAGIATAIKGREKCILLSAPLAGKTPRYLSSPETGDRCTAATATLKLGAEPAFRKANTKKEGGTSNAMLFLFSLSFTKPACNYARKCNWSYLLLPGVRRSRLGFLRLLIMCL